METSCRCGSPSDWLLSFHTRVGKYRYEQSRNEEGWKKSANGLTGSQLADYLGPNLGPGLDFVKRKMAPDNEPKKVATATQFNDARIYKLVHVENFGWKRGKIF